jgi:hypothetical protein
MKAVVLIFLEQFGQATGACLLAMTSGDIKAIGLEHWLTALTTGMITGLLGAIVTLSPLRRHYSNRWFVAAMTFIITTIADWTSHPSHFGGQLTEAIVTGGAASLLSLILSNSAVRNTINRVDSSLRR